MNSYHNHPYYCRGGCFGCSEDTTFKPIGSLVMCEKCFTEESCKHPEFYGKL